MRQPTTLQQHHQAPSKRQRVTNKNLACCAYMLRILLRRPTDRPNTFLTFFSTLFCCSFLELQRLVIENFIRLSIRLIRNLLLISTLHTIYMTLSFLPKLRCVFSIHFSPFSFRSDRSLVGFGMISQTNCHPKFILSILLCNFFVSRQFFHSPNKDSFIIC